MSVLIYMFIFLSLPLWISSGVSLAILFCIVPFAWSLQFVFKRVTQTCAFLITLARILDMILDFAILIVAVKSFSDNEVLSGIIIALWISSNLWGMSVITPLHEYLTTSKDEVVVSCCADPIIFGSSEGMIFLAILGTFFYKLYLIWISLRDIRSPHWSSRASEPLISGKDETQKSSHIYAEFVSFIDLVLMGIPLGLTAFFFVLSPRLSLDIVISSSFDLLFLIKSVSLMLQLVNGSHFLWYRMKKISSRPLQAENADI